VGADDSISGRGVVRDYGRDQCFDLTARALVKFEDLLRAAKKFAELIAR